LNLIKTIPLSHQGKSYDVRVYSDGYNILVKAFAAGTEANGFSHSVTLPVAFDMKNQLGMDAVEMLVEDAKRDVVEGRWEQFVKAWTAQHSPH